MKFAKSKTRRRYLARKNLWFKIIRTVIEAKPRRLAANWTIEHQRDLEFYVHPDSVKALTRTIELEVLNKFLITQ